MRSPVGELVGAARRIIARPRNDSPVPYVGRAGVFGGYAAADTASNQQTAIDAYGVNGTLFAICGQLGASVAAETWHMHRRTGNPADLCELCSDEDREPGYALVDKHPALSVWDRPNKFYTNYLFVETFEQYLDLVGEAWWVVAYLGNRPIELWPVRPDRMAPVRSETKFIAGYVYRSPDGTMVPLKTNEVVQLRQPAPWDPYRGAGAVQTIIAQVYGSKYAAEWNRRFFENSAQPGGVIEMPVHLQDREWNEFQERWAESHKGVSNAHTVAVLEHGAKWVDAKYTQRDMEFPKLTEVTSAQIREAFAMHGHVLGLSESVNRANAEAAEYGFAKRQTLPRLRRVGDALNTPFLELFDPTGMGPAAGYCFALTGSPVPEDREADNAERTSKAQAFKTYLDAGAAPSWAAEVVGLPEPRMAPKPKAPATPPPGESGSDGPEGGEGGGPDEGDDTPPAEGDEAPSDGVTFGQFRAQLARLGSA